jgi:hypothetical protein
MAHFNWKSLSGVVLIYAGGILAGTLLSWLRVPLPWMIGPMVLAGCESAPKIHPKADWHQVPDPNMQIRGLAGVMSAPIVTPPFFPLLWEVNVFR